MIMFGTNEVNFNGNMRNTVHGGVGAVYGNHRGVYGGLGGNNMTDDKRTIANLAKLLTDVQQENKRLRAENEQLRSKAAQWQNTFIALAEQHFAQGGKAPNLPMAAISCTVAPKALPFELINNNDYVTVVMMR